MGTIYITRHGETTWNTLRKMQGQKNTDLTERGILQSKWLRKRLEDCHIDLIYSSSLERALHTANIVRGSRNVPIIETDALREINLGCWEGMTFEEVSKLYPKEFDYFWKEPKRYVPIDGEDFETLNLRARTFLEMLFEKHPNEDILIVAHAVILKALLNVMLCNGDLDKFWDGPILKPTCLSEIEYEDGCINVKMFGDTSHYRSENHIGSWFFDEE